MFKPAYISTSAPTVNDDLGLGFRKGTFWWRTSTDTLYVSVDDADGAADWKTVSSGDIGSWASWSPSYTWTGNTPTGITTVARYINVGDICVFTLDVAATTAAGSSLTDFSFTTPETASDNNNLVPVSHYAVVGGTPANTNIAYVNCDTVGEVEHQVFNSIAQSTAFVLYYSGFFEFGVAP